MWDVNKIRSDLDDIAKRDKPIKEIKSDIFDILSKTSKEERGQLQDISSQEYKNEKQDAIRKRNLSFITPHLDVFWEFRKSKIKKKEKINIVGEGNRDEDNLKSEKNFLDRDYDRDYWETNQTILDKKVIDKGEVANLSEKEVRQKYKNEHLKKLPQNVQERIGTLSDNLIKENNGKKLEEGVLVAIPAYVKDDINEHKKAITAIKKQTGDFKAIFYVNWFDEEYDKKTNKRIDTNATTPDMMEKRISELRKEAWGDDRIVIVWNLYKARKPIWTIRADISDTIIKSMKEEIPNQENRALVCLDADTWKMDQWYIEWLSDLFTKDKNKKFASWKLRRATSDPVGQELVWLNEVVGLLWWRLQPHDQSKEVFSSGAVSSFRMKDYMKVKWFERGLWRWEDSAMWKKMEWYYSKDWKKINKDVGYWYNKKVYVDPKRAQQAIVSGKQAWQQWGKEFNPVDKNDKNQIKQWDRYDLWAKITESDLNKANSIISKLITNKEVPSFELNQVVSYINNVISSFKNSKNRDDANLKFSKFWNTQANSKYFVDIRKWKISLEDKNMSAESLLSQWAIEIASGLQYRVLEKSGIIYKIPNTDDQVLAQKKRLWNTDSLEEIKAERDLSINAVTKTNILNVTWSKKQLANSKILSNWIIIQDKTTVVQHKINAYEKENSVDKLEQLFKKYAENIIKTRKYWFSDYVFNFWYNSWVDKENRVVLFDFGEVVNKKSEVADLIKNRKRKASFDYWQLSDRSKKIYNEVMGNYITEKNLNKYRGIKNKNSK